MGKTSKVSSKPAMTKSSAITKSSVGDEEIKREKRRVANRRSALKSRYRETVMLEELQRNTSELSVQNATLRQENESLRSLAATIRKVQSEAQQTAQIKSCLLMLGGANTNTFQQASQLHHGLSYQQLLNIISAAGGEVATAPTSATQAAALVQQFRLPSDHRRPAYM